MADIMKQLSGMRGLKLFIADIRNCKTPEEEAKRVEKEMGKIRKKFTSTKKLDGYNQRKVLFVVVDLFLSRPRCGALSPL